MIVAYRWQFIVIVKESLRILQVPIIKDDIDSSPPSLIKSIIIIETTIYKCWYRNITTTM